MVERRAGSPCMLGDCFCLALYLMSLRTVWVGVGVSPVSWIGKFMMPSLEALALGAWCYQCTRWHSLGSEWCV
ncbi:hypothetical protein F5Y10DRAFT_229297 [Nemania abortiva]|nr:hypothetical protein F5Y10DRAFT_229297 [Nemania abortiva]